MYRLLVAVALCGVAWANPIVDVPVGMQWAREFNDSSYDWHAANDQAGKTPAEPTQATLFISMLRVDSPAAQPDPWQTRQYQPGVQMEASLQRADGTAAYGFTEPSNRPFAGTATLVPNIAAMIDSDGGLIPLSDVEEVPLDPSEISTFLTPGANFYLYVKPLTMDVQIMDVELSVSGWDPAQQTGFGTSATPVGGWQVVSADDPLGDPPATVPEPSPALLVLAAILAALTWRWRICRR